MAWHLRFLVLLVGLPMFAALPQASDVTAWKNLPTCVQSVEQLRGYFEINAQMDEVEAAFSDTLNALPNPAWALGYCAALSQNLKDKDISLTEGVSFPPKNMIATAIQYEAFRIQAFHDSGVSPKRFFGFLDEQGKSAVQEKQLKDVATQAAVLLNAYGARNGIKTTVTPKEIIVTHLAEGGAKLLTTDFANVERIDPVFGVGLDDFRIRALAEPVVE